MANLDNSTPVEKYITALSGISDTNGVSIKDRTDFKDVVSPWLVFATTQNKNSLLFLKLKKYNKKIKKLTYENDDNIKTADGEFSKLYIDIFIYFFKQCNAKLCIFDFFIKTLNDLKYTKQEFEEIKKLVESMNKIFDLKFKENFKIDNNLIKYIKLYNFSTDADIKDVLENCKIGFFLSKNEKHDKIFLGNEIEIKSIEKKVNTEIKNMNDDLKELKELKKEEEKKEEEEDEKIDIEKMKEIIKEIKEIKEIIKKLNKRNLIIIKKIKEKNLDELIIKKKINSNENYMDFLIQNKKKIYKSGEKVKF